MEKIDQASLARRKETINDKIIDHLASAGAGQLIVTEPEDDTADLVIEKRGKYYKETKLYLYIRECKKDIDRNVFFSSITEKKEDFGENSYLLFINFDIVKQDILEYVWLIPVNTFFMITEADESGSRRFEVSSDEKTESKYLRFLVDKNYLASILIRIFEEGNEIFSAGKKLEDFGDFKMEDLRKFIAEARRNTFAGNGVSADNPRLKGSKELEFRKVEWQYQDIYFSGKSNLIGQEIVYYNTRPVWGMNYFGNQPGEKETEFLKRALYDLAEKCRLGGKCELRKKDFFYEDAGQGTIENFQGQEKISVNQKNVYKLDYRGGIIKK